MSDNVPFEIQVEIIKRLPVRSLIQFRSVSKSWKSLVDSSEFITSYSSVQQQHRLLVVSYKHDSQLKYASIVEDDSFPQKRVVSLTIPLLLKYPTDIIGCSHGLLCLYEKGHDGLLSGKGRAVIWNPSIRKAVVVVVPNVANRTIYDTLLGFGVCRETTDPKILKVTQIRRLCDMETVSCIPCQVEVFTLSTGCWRSSPYGTGNLPRKSIQFGQVQVVVDGILYWLATDRIAIDGELRSYNLIISFDMTSEEFGQVDLPDSLARYMYHWSLSMYKLRESLVVFESDVEDTELDLTVWMMEDGASRTFTKLFSFNLPHSPIAFVIGFKKTGEPIIETVQDDVTGSIAVYEPNSKHITYIGIAGENLSFKVDPYVETLLLLDQPDFIVYDKGDRYISKPLSEEYKAFEAH